MNAPHVTDAPMSPPPGDLHMLLPPHRSLGTALSAGAALLMVLVIVIWLLVDPALTPKARLVVAGLGLSFILSLWTIARALSAPQGGLYLDNDGRRLGFGLSSEKDRWWLPFEALGPCEISLDRPALDAKSTARWILTLQLVGPRYGGLELIVAESIDRDGLLDAQDFLQQCLPPPTEAPAPRPFKDSHQGQLAVKRGAALGPILATFGLSLILVSLIGFSEISEAPLIGFLFSPVLFFLGLALMLITFIKRFASEELRLDHGTWHHRFRLGRWRWAHRELHAPGALFRVHLRGIRGAVLELASNGTVLILGAGATTQSQISLDDLAAFHLQFRE